MFTFRVPVVASVGKSGSGKCDTRTAVVDPAGTFACGQMASDNEISESTLSVTLFYDSCTRYQPDRICTAHIAEDCPGRFRILCPPTCRPGRGTLSFAREAPIVSGVARLV